MSNPKLSPAQRAEAAELVDQIMEDPERFAFELVSLRAQLEDAQARDNVSEAIAYGKGL